MVRVTLASAALVFLAAVEEVIAGSPLVVQGFQDSSGLDACKQIAAAISSASVVYYPRESSITMPRSGVN